MFSVMTQLSELIAATQDDACDSTVFAQARFKSNVLRAIKASQEVKHWNGKENLAKFSK